MTELTSTLFRIVRIGGKRYALGLHPLLPESLISIRECGRRIGYVVPVSTVRVQGALAFGRAELSAKRVARKNGVPWRTARRIFLASVMPPTIKQNQRKSAVKTSP